MKKNTNFKSILALVLCTVLLLTAMLALSSCKKDKFVFELSEDESYYTLVKYNGKDANVEIPESHKDIPVKSIGSEAFSGKNNLTSVVLTANIETIGYKAFENCAALTSITFTDNVKTIDKAAFSGCTSLTEIVIPASVTAIDDAVFMDCTALTSVGISKNVTKISSYAFIGCSALTSINVNSENHHYTVKNNCLINLETDTIVVGMKGATIPESLGIVAIAPNAFYSRAIENIVIPESVKSIGALAFYNCTSLESVEILGAETIGQYAFTGCSLLRKMVLSVSITEIGDEAFALLPKLTNVFYTGHAHEFSAITLGEGNADLMDAHIYYYTDEKPAGDGKYWHYVDGNIAIWF